MKTKAMTSILALAVVTVTVALAQERFDMLVRQDFFAGFNGNREALERGMKITEDTLAKDPNHAEARVWHGSGILYLSGQAFQKGDQQNGMKLWRQGLDEMEQAVRLAPNNVAVLIRGHGRERRNLFSSSDAFARLFSKFLRAFKWRNL